MNVMDIIVCPICGEKLNVDGKTATCKNRHSFDRAREGYFYLLPPNGKNSLSPGDNKDMVLARAKFLATGSYGPLADRLAEIVTRFFPRKITLLDAGVGTGYYLARIASIRGNIDERVGIDIPKEAVRRAARADGGAFTAVASVFDIPLASGSADVAVSVFSPFADRELSRVLKSDGILLCAVPAERHLIELREALYDNVRPVESALSSEFFSPLAREELTYDFELNGSEAISALLAMTPYAYRAPLDRIAEVKAREKMTLTADFEIYTFQKQ